VRENGAAQVGFALSVALSETIFPHEIRKKKINGQISNQFFDTIGHSNQVIRQLGTQFSMSPSSRTL
jgi:hypothetical protein